MSTLKHQTFFLVSFLASLFLMSCTGPEKAPSIKEPITWVNQLDQHFPVDFENKTTFLIFLTDGCDGCSQLSPILKKIADQFVDKLTLIGIFTPQVSNHLTQVEANSYLEKSGIFYPVIFDNNASILNAYQINGWPTVILINQKGIIKKRIYGVKNDEYLTKLVQSTIEENK